MPNWPSFHQPSLALGSRCPKPTFTTKDLRHKPSRPQHHQQLAHNPPGRSGGRSKRQGLSKPICGKPQQRQSLHATFCPAFLPPLTAWPPTTGWHSSVPWILSQTLVANQMTTSAAVPAADTIPQASQPDATDASMPQASPASLPLDFPDGATASTMLLWAEDNELPLDMARQAVQHVHAQHSQQFSQHASASHVSLPEPL